MNPQNVQSLTDIMTSPSYYLRSIADSLSELSSNPWVMYGVIANLMVVLIAIYAANKDSINGCFFKPKICMDKSVFSVEQKGLLISRLKVNNIKKTVAKNVSFSIEKLWYFKNAEWQVAQNFLSFPLRWTHINIDSRDLFFKKPYFLDFCEIANTTTNNGSNLSFHLCAIYGGPKRHGLDDLKIGRNKIQLTLYCENHPIKNYFIELKWDGTFCHPTFIVSNSMNLSL